MENREQTRYIVLANVQGKKTAIQLDGLYAILPPQNFPSQIPKQIQYKDERLPLYQAHQLIGFYEKEFLKKGPYEKLYRDLLAKIKEIIDEIADLKKELFPGIEGKLISMLFDFGIKLRREENPDDENIKRGEKMLALLQGADKEVIKQEEVDRFLSEFLK